MIVVIVVGVFFIGSLLIMVVFEEYVWFVVVGFFVVFGFGFGMGMYVYL